MGVQEGVLSMIHKKIMWVQSCLGAKYRVICITFPTLIYKMVFWKKTTQVFEMIA